MLVVFVAVLGLLIGSFLNVVIWRVPRAESIVSPPSACPNCGAQIRPYDNVPVVSWLVLQGRCRNCRHPISPRYPLVEAGTAVAFAAVAWRFGFDARLPAYLYLTAVAIALALIDVDVKRLPDVITLPSFGVGLVLLAIDGVHHPHALLRGVVGAAAMFAVYFAICFAYPAGMGFGDVKLSGVLGLYTAYLEWSVWAAGLLLGFLVGGFFGIGLVLLKRGGRKTAVPFGPFMIGGAFLAIFFGHQLVASYLHLTTGS